MRIVQSQLGADPDLPSWPASSPQRWPRAGTVQCCWKLYFLSSIMSLSTPDSTVVTSRMECRGGFVRLRQGLVEGMLARHFRRVVWALLLSFVAVPIRAEYQSVGHVLIWTPMMALVSLGWWFGSTCVCNQTYGSSCSMRHWTSARPASYPLGAPRGSSV